MVAIMNSNFFALSLSNYNYFSRASFKTCTNMRLSFALLKKNCSSKQENVDYIAKYITLRRGHWGPKEGHRR